VSVDVRKMVETMGASLMTGQVLTSADDYQQRSASSLGILLLLASQEWDHSAERLTLENAATRELFAAAAPALAGELRERVQAAARSSDPGLRISELVAANDELRRLLIELHAHVEERDDAQAAEIDAAIWRELVRSTERRQLPASPF